MTNTPVSAEAPAPDDMNDLTERVARVMCRERHPCWSIVAEIFETDHDRQATEFRDYARAAIRIALHEAAKVAVFTINSRPELTSYDVWLAICDLIPTGTIPAQDDTGNSE